MMHNIEKGETIYKYCNGIVIEGKVVKKTISGYIVDIDGEFELIYGSDIVYLELDDLPDGYYWVR